VAAGKTEAGRAFAKEAYITRRDEMTSSRRALGQSEELVFLNSTPIGDFVCVYLEGDDPVAGNRGFAASRSPFDTWFKDECLEIFAPGVDFYQPLPPIETLLDYVKEPVKT
jgi:hypothetical protein